MTIKAIPGYPGYFATDEGDIYSTMRTKNNVPKKRKLTRDKDGRPIVNLMQNKKLTSRLVHRLVLLAFVGECPASMEACHNDGDYLNNHIVNLRWDSRASNEEDKKNHGQTQRGEKNVHSKLKEDDVFRIRELLRRGFSQARIGRMFGITIQSVHLIKTKKNWNWLKYVKPEQVQGRLF